jgi:tripartite ATP-independent transporter DctM subunit
MTAALIGFAAVLGLAFVGLPLGIAMLLVGLAGFAVLRGFDAALVVLGQQVADASFNYGLSVLPMFILMGAFIHRSGVADELYDAAQAWVGHVRGGLAHATVAACAMFGMISGSSLACAATMAKVAIPQMRKRGYSDSLSSGCVASAGVLGMLIPPSVPLMVYGLIADQDIRKLFIAVTLPGLMVALLFVLAIVAQGWMRPQDVPLGGDKPSLRERLRASKGVLSTLLLFAIVIGGMYGGVFTVTEAAGIGSLGALLIAQARGRMGLSGLIAAAVDAGKTTGMLFLIVFGAMIFTNFINLSGFAGLLGEWVQQLGLGRIGVLIAISCIYLLLGCVLETLGLMLLTVPIFLPIVVELGVSPIWFGVYLVLMVEIGQLTPPVGMNVLTVRSMLPDLKTATIFRGVMPFLLFNALAVLLVIAFPAIVMAPLRWVG